MPFIDRYTSREPGQGLFDVRVRFLVSATLAVIGFVLVAEFGIVEPSSIPPWNHIGFISAIYLAVILMHGATRNENA